MVKHRPMGFKFALLTILCAVATPAFAAEPTIEELLNATDDVNRGESSHCRSDSDVCSHLVHHRLQVELSS